MGLNGKKDNIQCIKLDTLDDIKALIIDIIQQCGDAGLMVEKSSSINGLMNTWVRCNAEQIQHQEIKEIREQIAILMAEYNERKSVS